MSEIANTLTTSPAAGTVPQPGSENSHNLTRTYSIIRSIRNAQEERDQIVCSGLPWEEARAKCAALQAAERTKNPGKSSWTIDIYYCQLEGTPRMQALLAQQPVTGSVIDELEEIADQAAQGKVIR